MDIFRFRKLDQPGPHNAVLTIGNFDGVHRGHQGLIRRVVEEAARLDATGALMTFQPHPQSVLGQRRVPIITGIAHRVHLFQSLGLDAAYFIPFTRELAATPPEDFVQEYLLGYFQVKKLIIGYDFHFGRGRQGGAGLLEELSLRHGFDLEVFPEYVHEGEKVSSSSIREAILKCDFARATDLLGRPYSVLATVEQDAGRGRKLGFPTINQRCKEIYVLPFGVYACRVNYGGETYGGVANYGMRPTVDGRTAWLETHLFGFSGQIYNEMVEVIPLLRLREERTFAGLDDLKAQITRDADAAREFLAGM
ncbi:MAG: bifunctional riboflavin kinase/FAD synthetase [Deltaproteobacteria bacterium]|nr:bifunctional riboflavin kinase/FAD synthetase [Deltaproteobacteria bacterium]